MSMWQVMVNWSGISAPGFSSHYFDVAGGGTPQQVNDAVGTFWGALDDFIAVGISWSTAPEVRQINEVTGALQSVSPVTPAAGAGIDAGAMLPLAQGLIRWNTGQIENGRVVKGRTFVPGPVEDSNDGAGLPNAAYIAGLQAPATALATSLHGLVVYRRPVFDALGNRTRDGGLEDVISGTISPSWAYLSSRRT